MSAESKEQALKQWEARRGFISATTALGMGIDVSDLVTPLTRCLSRAEQQSACVQMIEAYAAHNGLDMTKPSRRHWTGADEEEIL